jgi:hypothetical protein
MTANEIAASATRTHDGFTGTLVEGAERADHIRAIAEELLAGMRGPDPLDAGQALDPELAVFMLDYADSTRCRPPLGKAVVRAIASEVAREILLQEGSALEGGK